MEGRRSTSYPQVSGIGPEDHRGLVREVFATVPERYDFLNHFLSLRRDVAWRRFAVKRMGLPDGGALLDVATGTGDLAVMAARRFPSARVVGVDLVEEMLGPARVKIARAGFSGRVALMIGDAMALPFPEGSFDAVAVAFGIRNMPDRTGALREMARVTRPGGRVLVLEMTLPTLPVVRPLYRGYLTLVLPRLAGFFTRNPGAYRYLADSIVHFPRPETLAGMMEDAGLAKVRWHALTLGATCLHVGEKPDRGASDARQAGIGRGHP